MDKRHVIHVSVADQKMLVTDRGEAVSTYPISTSKYGLSSRPGSYGTPLGKHRVARKIGHGLPLGAVLKSRRFTGEILPVDAPGRDPIVTRILWLRGVERGNGNSFSRLIYIHGTPEERNIGSPSSYGCIRMRSKDVTELFARVGVGAKVDIFRDPLAVRFPKLFKQQEHAAPAPQPAATPAEMAAIPAAAREL
ncbi:MAG: L,D-transpeptidase [Chthoniobacterales bacterium]|nr:L,D-transpeptidase [Chthoniobacterales bacterium]